MSELDLAVAAESAAPERSIPRGRSASWTTLIAIRIVIAAALVGIWQWIVHEGYVNKAILPGPGPTFKYLWFNVLGSHDVWVQVGSTMNAVLVSFLIGSAAGVLIGFLLVTFPKAGRVLDFYLTLVNSFPRVALAPLFIALFGLGQTAKIVTSITVIVFIVIAGTVSGASAVDSDLAMLFKAVGASRGTVFIRLVLPSSIPSIFSALKLALVYSALAVVVTEMIGSDSGIGYRVNYLSNTFRMDGVIALLLLLAVITVCLAGIMNVIERRLTRWR